MRGIITSLTRVLWNHVGNKNKFVHEHNETVLKNTSHQPKYASVFLGPTQKVTVSFFFSSKLEDIEERQKCSSDIRWYFLFSSHSTLGSQMFGPNSQPFLLLKRTHNGNWVRSIDKACKFPITSWFHTIHKFYMSLVSFLPLTSLSLSLSPVSFSWSTGSN